MEASTGQEPVAPTGSDSDRSGTIVLVPPRYGAEVVGGAEAVVGELGRGLADRGWKVEILTTCAKDHYTWANEYLPGVEIDGNLTIRRFPTVIDTPGRHRRHLGDQILKGSPISVTDQLLWINDSLRVPELWHHVLQNAHSYRAVVVAPYMFWTTFAVGQIAPERTILMPCLHDEPTARLEIFGPLFAGSRGVWFLSDPEAELARQLFELPRRNEVVGAGIDVPPSYDPAGFRARHRLEGPFIYYAGRREWGKGWLELVKAFEEFGTTSSAPLTLVTSGVGEPGLPAAVGSRVLDLGFVSDQDRSDAMAAATAYVQPSALESFSRTVLEAWLAETAVVANGASDVVSWHVQRSGAGLVYRTNEELVQALRMIAEEPGQFGGLAAGGRQYVLDNYQWPGVLDRIEQTLRSWTAPS